MSGLRPEIVKIICDTRERNPWKLEPFRVEKGTLDTADYAILGLEKMAGIERKELGDLIQCVTFERPRFERALGRMIGLPHKVVICECSWSDLVEGRFRSKASPQSVTGSIIAWMARFSIPFIFPGGRPEAEQAAVRWLMAVANQYWRISEEFRRGVEE